MVGAADCEFERILPPLVSLPPGTLMERERVWAERQMLLSHLKETESLWLLQPSQHVSPSPGTLMGREGVWVERQMLFSHSKETESLWLLQPSQHVSPSPGTVMGREGV